MAPLPQEESKQQMTTNPSNVSIKVDDQSLSLQLTNNASSSSSRATTTTKSPSRPSSRGSSRQASGKPLSQRASSRPSARAAANSIESASSASSSPAASPKAQRTVEETLGFYQSPVTTGGHELHPLITFTIDNKPQEALQYLHSLPIHERQAAATACDDEGNPALFHALAPTHAAILALLIDYGADVTAVNDKRNTALHIACYYQYKKAMATLIEHGANLKAENWEHQQCHQMLKTNDKIQQTQNYLNSVYEAHAAKLEAKQVPVVDGALRSYLRSLFDIADPANVGAIPYDTIARIVNDHLQARKIAYEQANPQPIVRLTAADREKLKEKAKAAVVVPEEDWAKQFFSSIDLDHNGVLNFPEFLVVMLALRAEQENEKSKKSSAKSKKGKGKAK